MDPLIIGALVGGGTGLLKAHEQAKAARDKSMVASERDRYSPWTGLKGQMADTPSPLGTVLAGAASGAAAGQKWIGSPDTSDQEAEDGPDESVVGSGYDLNGTNLGGPQSKYDILNNNVASRRNLWNEEQNALTGH